MTVKEAVKTVVAVFIVALAALPALAQSQTAGEFWPAVDAHVNLPNNWGLLGFVGTKKGEDFPYQELYEGLGVGYKLKTISKAHIKNIDPEKEYYATLGGGYERLDSVSSGKPSSENRLALQALLGYRLTSHLLASDRNRVEFRWVNGNYSTRYRNNVGVLYDLVVHGYHFSPYANAEFFYNGQYDSWNEQQYTAGIEWPYKHWLSVQTYYLRENCTTCNPPHLDVGGLTVNFFF